MRWRDASAGCVATQSFGTNDFSGFHTNDLVNLFAKTHGLDALLVDPAVLHFVHSKIVRGSQRLIGPVRLEAASMSVEKLRRAALLWDEI